MTMKKNLAPQGNSTELGSSQGLTARSTQENLPSPMISTVFDGWSPDLRSAALITMTRSDETELADSSSDDDDLNTCSRTSQTHATATAEAVDLTTDNDRKTPNGHKINLENNGSICLEGGSSVNDDCKDCLHQLDKELSNGENIAKDECECDVDKVNTEISKDNASKIVECNLNSNGDKHDSIGCETGNGACQPESEAAIAAVDNNLPEDGPGDTDDAPQSVAASPAVDNDPPVDGLGDREDAHHARRHLNTSGNNFLQPVIMDGKPSNIWTIEVERWVLAFGCLFKNQIINM